MGRNIILVLVVLSQAARVPFSAVDPKVQPAAVELLSEGVEGCVIVRQMKKSVWDAVAM